MKTKLLTVALLASAALIAPVYAGGHHGNGGGNYIAGGRGSARSGGGPSFQSMPARSFGGNRMIYSGQHFSSIGSNQVVRGNIDRVNRSTQFSNTGNRAITNARHDGNGARQVRSGNNLPTNWRNHVV